MKAFLAACLAIVVITVGANFYLTSLDVSSERVYSTANVRLH